MFNYTTALNMFSVFNNLVPRAISAFKMAGDYLYMETCLFPKNLSYAK